MAIIDLAMSPMGAMILAGIYGLMIGSFLNVVIYRLPIMMERDWRSQCDELFGLADNDKKNDPTTYNLSTPSSRCPHCGHVIRWWENIPVISYLWLKGKCSECSEPISIRYPTVEAMTALLSVIVVWQLGPTIQAVALLLLTWGLIALTMIDVDHQLLPDSITLPLLWIGLLLSIYEVFIPADEAIIGAIAGYLSLWSFYWLFKLLTGKEGMGYGDFKLLAMFGAWVGWKSVFLIILLSSFVGAIIGIAMILFAGHEKQKPIPFGPYLAIAGWLALLWGDEIIHSYLVFSGLR